MLQRRPNQFRKAPANERYARVALNAIRLAEVRLVHAVDLCQLDVLLLERGGRFLIVGRKSLAVTAPT